MVAYKLYLKHMHVIVIDANFLRNSVLYLPINRHKSNFISVNQTLAANYLHHRILLNHVHAHVSFTSYLLNSSTSPLMVEKSLDKTMLTLITSVVSSRSERRNKTIIKQTVLCQSS